MIEKIISGGQTGVDRAALDVAIELKIPHGGWCPKERLSESGTIPFHYSLQETETSDYSERTKLNIRDSDGTLIIVPKLPVDVTDGTILTIQEVQDKRKPYYLFDLSGKEDLSSISVWLKKNNIRILNVAGPRESQSPGIYNRCYELLKKILG
jgi:hypothetical protein